MRRTLIILSAAGALTGLGLVAAQTGTTGTMTGGAAQTETQTEGQTQTQTEAQTNEATLTDATAQRLGRALLGRHLNLGTELGVTFYDGDPDAGGAALQTLTFTYGEDSEAAFVNDVAEAAQSAAFVRVTTSPQTQTFDLSALQAGAQPGAAFGPFGDGGPHGFGGPRGGGRGFR